MSKYQRWYDQIIERARQRSIEFYKEQHHVIPRALGGSDDPLNLVDLTYREHFLVHWLLTKLTSGRERMLMIYALHAMTMSLGGRLVAGWQIDVAKRALKREALIRAKTRYEKRHARLKLKWHEAQAGAVRAAEIAPQLTSGKQRPQLTALSSAWLKGHPSQRGGRRNRRVNNVDIKAKRVIAEANRLLGLPNERPSRDGPLARSSLRPTKRERSEPPA